MYVDINQITNNDFSLYFKGLIQPKQYSLVVYTPEANKGDVYIIEHLSEALTSIPIYINGLNRWHGDIAVCIQDVSAANIDNEKTVNKCWKFIERAINS